MLYSNQPAVETSAFSYSNAEVFIFAFFNKLSHLCFIVIQISFRITVLNIVKNVKNRQLENHKHCADAEKLQTVLCDVSNPQQFYIVFLRRLVFNIHDTIALELLSCRTHNRTHR
ncbi:hypothetical protein T12_2046 [Trichinella patagoniensis]|uniref:Uncharacterized protein n=1 Tax=Trichinella patagoniensis TaxID=990121 RepID=A0A0V0Z3G3_9BILA|nr:hypothetical protein T12_768 [Trichinella patagoniensis]KRY07087.1 hypothetical protein T12_2046 [Trichinella patagoniensis]